MSDRDYEELFNELLVKTRERRRGLKEELDRCFDEDPVRTSQILQEMWRINEKAQEIEGNRPGFMSLMAAIRSVKTTRQEVIERIDKLMEEVRHCLTIKEELAGERLDRLTTLFAEHLDNPSFKFHFHLLDDQELHHLSELRSLARKVDTSDDTVRPSLSVKVESRPSQTESPVMSEDTDPGLIDVKGSEDSEVPFPQLETQKEPVKSSGDWRSAPVQIGAQTSTTLHGVAPDEILTAEEGEVLPEAGMETQSDGTASPYEVDVDVLKILSEETFRPRKTR